MSLHPAAVRQLPRVLANVASRVERQVIVTSHSVDLVDDKGIEPSELLILQTTGSETIATAGSDLPELVAAARADMSLSGHVEALTRPAEYARLAQYGAKP
jgi:predicted ATPase